MHKNDYIERIEDELGRELTGSERLNIHGFRRASELLHDCELCGRSLTRGERKHCTTCRGKMTDGGLGAELTVPADD